MWLGSYPRWSMSSDFAGEQYHMLPYTVSVVMFAFTRYQIIGIRFVTMHIFICFQFKSENM